LYLRKESAHGAKILFSSQKFDPQSLKMLRRIRGLSEGCYLKVSLKPNPPVFLPCAGKLLVAYIRSKDFIVFHGVIVNLVYLPQGT